MLTCKQATFYSAIKSFQKLPFVRRIQLKMHLMMCENCHEFDHQSKIIDKTLVDIHQNETLQSEEKLSEANISNIKKAVNQQLK